MKKINGFEMKYLKKHIKDLTKEEFQVELISESGEEGSNHIRIIYKEIPLYLDLNEDRHEKIEEVKNTIMTMIKKFEKISKSPTKKDAVNYINAMLFNKYSKDIIDIMFSNRNMVVQPLMKQRIEKIYKKNKENFERTYIKCVEEIGFEKLITANRWDRFMSWLLVIKGIVEEVNESK